MAAVPFAPLLTYIEQAGAAKECALRDVNATWEKLTRAYENNTASLSIHESKEAFLQKRIQRAQTDWRKERRRCKKRGLQKAQKRINRCIWDWRPVGKKRGRLVGDVARKKNRHEFARWSLDQAKEAERMANILYREDDTRTPFLSSFQEIEQLYERIADDKHRLVIAAGIPENHHEAVHVTSDDDGNTHFYFGGLDSPDGLDHGHYVMNPAGVVFYQRNPGELHGGHNYLPEYQLATA